MKKDGGKGGRKYLDRLRSEESNKTLSLSPRLGCGKFNSAYTISLIRFIRGIAVALNDVRAEGNA